MLCQCLQRAKLRTVKYRLFYPSKCWYFQCWGPPRGRGGGYMFPCSLEKIGVFSLFPKNKLRCSLKFTFIKFPCSQKFCCMFPWSPEILINVPQNFNHISVFDGQYFRKFYLVSHSRDNPQQNASFVSLMNAASLKTLKYYWTALTSNE